MRIAIIGSTGQLGTDLMRTLREKHGVIGLTHQNVEVTDYNNCQVLKKDHLDLIINTAAFHKTDQCEDEPLKAFAVNAVGAKNVTTISKEIQAITMYISTDYVFDGKKTTPYTETDTPTPINTYGISKLAGELYTEQNPRHYIIRIASLFGTAGASGKGGNFVETMITKAKKNETLSVVNDIWMSPTYTKDAAATIEKIVEKELPFGTYHAANDGHCTWFEFTKEILKLTGLTPVITPTKTDQLQTRARRPIFSALRSEKLLQQGIRARGWKEALADYLDEKGYLEKNGSCKQT